MLTNGKYFEEYLNKLPIKDSLRKRNTLLSSIIKRLGDSKKFEKAILDVRKQCSIPADGYTRDERDDGFRLVGYNFSAEVSKVSDEFAKQYKKWGVPIHLREILARFVLCNEPIYFDYRKAKGSTEFTDFSVKIDLPLPINSKTELDRYIDLIWPTIEAHQQKKGYKKERARAFLKAERNQIVREIHNKLISSKDRGDSDIISRIKDELDIQGIELQYDSIKKIIYG